MAGMLKIYDPMLTPTFTNINLPLFRGQNIDIFGIESIPCLVKYIHKTIQSWITRKWRQSVRPNIALEGGRQSSNGCSVILGRAVKLANNRTFGQILIYVEVLVHCFLLIMTCDVYITIMRLNVINKSKCIADLLEYSKV